MAMARSLFISIEDPQQLPPLPIQFTCKQPAATLQILRISRLFGHDYQLTDK
jgi:hypothetical protein